jgi:hypothetical protein
VGQFVIQLQGQPRVRYFIQNSSNQIAWTTVATNTLTSSTLNLTNPSSSPVKFWRALWQP